MLRTVIGSCLFYLGLVLVTIPYSFVALLCLPFPRKTRYRIITLWNRFIISWLKITCCISWKVNGLGNIPAKGPYIVMSNHQSAWETIAFLTLFDPLVIILKRELLWIPFFGWALSMLDPIALDRGSARQSLKQLMREAKKRLNNSECLIIFPEGTRVSPNKESDYKLGGAVIACDNNIPVLPVAHDAGKYWPRKSFVKKPGEIKITIGKALDTELITPKELNKKIKEWIEKHK